MKVFEFGGGGSSLWFDDIGVDLTVVEHDEQWHDELKAALDNNTHLVLRQPAKAGVCKSDRYVDLFFDDYVASIDGTADRSLDIVVIDGRCRVACGLAAMPKVKPGGLLVLDDSNRSKYLPLRDALAGWSYCDYRGVKLGGIAPPAQTTIWRRPASA